MKVTIERRLPVQERAGSVLVRDGEIWAYGTQTRKVLRYTGVRTEELKLGSPLPRLSTEDAALTWDGDGLLVADRSRRRVYRVDAASGKETVVMDPETLELGDYGRSLASAATVIGDIAWHDGLLYLAVQSGYSSAIYGIDLSKKTVVSHRFAPGPKPSGLEFDPVDGSMYTIDNRNREMRRFAKGGAMDVAELPSEWGEPRGLSYESDRRLWSTDWSKGDLLCLKMED